MKETIEKRGLYRKVTRTPESDVEQWQVLKSLSLERYLDDAERIAGKILSDAGIDDLDALFSPVVTKKGSHLPFAEINRESLSVDARQALDVVWYVHIARSSLDSKAGRDGLTRGLWLAGAAERLNANIAFLMPVVARKASNKNLENKPKVSDDQILEIVNDDRYPTREKQASRLGITPRQIQKRLKEIKNK